MVGRRAVFIGKRIYKTTINMIESQGLRHYSRYDYCDDVEFTDVFRIVQLCNKYRLNVIDIFCIFICHNRIIPKPDIRTLIVLIALFSFAWSSVLSQSCLPEGITFNSQEQIDSF